MTSRSQRACPGRPAAWWLAPLLAAAPASAQDLDPVLRPTRWRVGAERLDDAGQELWLVGTHFDLLDPFRSLPGVYVGLGGYAAVEGDSGGFLAGGATVGYRRPLAGGLSVDTGVFGGLGGGGRLGLDGFLYRPHVALQQELGPVDLRVELAYLDLPDADLEDLHVAFGISLPSELLLVRPSRIRRSDLPDEAVREHRVRRTPTWLHLEEDGGSRRRSDGGPIGDVELLGLGLDYFVTDVLFLAAEAHGATGGDVPGFLMGLVGAGVSLPLGTERVRLEGKGLVGAGGGGDVDTGGGFGWQGLGGLAVDALAGFSVRALAGYTSFPDGHFDTFTTSLGVTWTVPAAEIAWDHPRTRLADERFDEDTYRPVETRVELLHKFHLPRGGSQKRDGTPLEDFELIGLGLEHPLIEPVLLTARAFGAYGGEADGYAEGLLGLRYEASPPRAPAHVFSLQGEVGAAGGGDVDVSSGLIYAVSLGYRYAFGESLHLLAEYGRTEADAGPFETDFVQLGLGWSLARPAYR